MPPSSVTTCGMAAWPVTLTRLDTAILVGRDANLRPLFFFFSSRRRHTRFKCDWSSDVCSSDLPGNSAGQVSTLLGAGLEQGICVRTGNGGEFCHVCSSLQLGLQAVQQVGMDAGIHFLAQDLLGALDGQRSHFLAPGFTGLDCLLLGLGAGSSN